MDRLKEDSRLLIVDDEPVNVELLEELLRHGTYTNFRSTSDPRTVMSILEEYRPDLLLLDLAMPHIDGFQIMERIRFTVSRETYFPILVLTADGSPQTRRKALQYGATDFLTKPFDVIEVLLRVKILLETRLLHMQVQQKNRLLTNHNETLEEKVRERTLQLEDSQLEILDRLAQAGEFRDEQTGQHTRRVGHLAALIAERMELAPTVVRMIRKVAPLHDLGKIAIPDSILLKPGNLSPREFDIVKSHTTIGAAMLSDGRSEPVKMAERIALSHHERWDGTGYPGGLSGDAIPIEGRIVALADVFDVLAHSRPYKGAWELGPCLDEIQRQAGRQFDPRVVAAFMALDHQALHVEEGVID